MRKYKWDETLIQDYMLDPIIGPDFVDLFDYIEQGNSVDRTNMSPMRVLARDCNFFDLNPFLEEYFDRIITPDTYTLRTFKSKRRISIPAALKLTKAFYGTMDTEIRNAFATHFQRRDTNLNASHSLFRTTFDGHCFCSNAARDCLIDFQATNRADMIFVLIHEYAHAMGFTLRDYTYTAPSYHVFSEVESIFMELLAALFLMNNTDLGDEALNMMTKIHREILESAKSTLEAYDLCSMVQDMHLRGRTINMDSVIAQAKKDYGENDMDKKYILSLLEFPIDRDTPYGYSALIAVELYFMYLDNPQEALDIFKRIVRLDTETAVDMQDEIERFGVVPAAHFSDFTRTLKK